MNKPITIAAIICMIALTTSTIIWMWDVKHETMEAIERGVQRASENKMQEQINKIEAALSGMSEGPTGDRLSHGLALWRKINGKEETEDRDE